MRLLLQHHGSIDLSDGLNAAAGAEASLYLRAGDTSTGTVNPWPARIGTDAPAGATPTHNATGWGGTSPTVEYVAGDNDYTDITADVDVAAQAADPNRVYSFGLKAERLAALTGYFLAWGSGDTWLTQGWYFASDGRIGFLSRRAGASPIDDDSLVSTATIALNEEVSIVGAYRGTSCRLTVHDGVSETVFFDGATVALTPANYPYTTLWLARANRTSSPVPMSGGIERYIHFPDHALADSEITALHDRLLAL